jgi:hypothetical protein
VITTTTRPVEVADVRRIEERSRRGCGESVGCFLFSGLLATVGGVLTIALTAHKIPGDWPDASQWRAMGTAFVLGAAAVGLVCFFLWRALAREDVERWAEDLARAEVEVVSVEALAAAVTEDGWFFDVGDGKLFFLASPGIVSAAGGAPFPTLSFTLDRLPVSRRVIRVEARGEPLAVFDVTTGKEDGVEIEFSRLEDGAVLEGRLETLKADVARHLQHQHERGDADAG